MYIASGMAVALTAASARTILEDRNLEFNIVFKASDLSGLRHFVDGLYAAGEYKSVLALRKEIESLEKARDDLKQEIMELSDRHQRLKREIGGVATELDRLNVLAS